MSDQVQSVLKELLGDDPELMNSIIQRLNDVNRNTEGRIFRSTDNPPIIEEEKCPEDDEACKDRARKFKEQQRAEGDSQPTPPATPEIPPEAMDKIIVGVLASPKFADAVKAIMSPPAQEEPPQTVQQVAGTPPVAAPAPAAVAPVGPDLGQRLSDIELFIKSLKRTSIADLPESKPHIVVRARYQPVAETPISFSERAASVLERMNQTN